MKHVLTLIITLVSTLVFAEAVVEKRGDRLYLRDDDCAVVKRSVLDLKKWTSGVDRNKTCSQVSSSNYGNNGCETDITDCVPDHVLKYQNAKPEVDGPNCWNLALVMKGILPALRYSSNDEMSFYMRPPLCRALADGEQREPGDVGAIREFRDNSEAHGFIYVNDDIVYSKDGTGKDHPYRLESFQTVVHGYGVPRSNECWNTQKSKSPACSKIVSYYRCDSMENYLKKNPDIPEELRAGLDRIMNFESCLSESVFSGEALSEEAGKNITDTTKALVAYLKTEKAKQQVGENTKYDFIIGSLQLRLRSIVTQLENLRSSDLMVEVAELGYMMDESLKDLRPQVYRQTK